MENNNNQQNNNGAHVPNMNVIKGLAAVIFGLMFIVFAAKIILQVIFFIAGFVLIYYGLRILNMKQATDYLEQVVAQIKKLLPW